MITIDSEHACLLELIKASLFDYFPIIPERVNWEKVFDVAKAQCIVPLVASCVPLEHREKWLDLLFQSKAHFMQLLYEQKLLGDLLSESNIPFVILKGTAAAVYYPNPSLRTFGDIDFYVSDDLANYANRILEENGYLSVFTNERHFEFAKNGMDFELHYRFSSQPYKDIDNIIINGLNHAIEYKIGNSIFPGLPAYENGLVLLGHIMQHLHDTGIGFRQIIDWMMFVHKELDDSAWIDKFKPLAVEAGLEKLAVTVTYMCKKWLGLPNTITWCDDADKELVDQLFVRVLDDGNFGRYRSPHEKVKNSMRKKGEFNYLQRAGIDNWSLAQKYAVFRPLAWLYQLLRYTFKGIIRILSGKKVFSEDINSMSLEELLKRLE